MQPWKLDRQILCCDLWIERLSDFTGLANTAVQTPSLDKLFLNCSINIQIIKIDVCLQQEQYVCARAHAHTHTLIFSFSIFWTAGMHAAGNAALSQIETSPPARCLALHVGCVSAD